MFGDPTVWIALFQIMMINILLSGDNAVVIALACRSLPPAQQKKAFLFGSLGVVVLMVALTAFAAYLLMLPYLELIGSLLLLWIGVKLLLPGDETAEIKDNSNMLDAVKTIIVADIVMSFDNVLGMAGAAKGHMWMLVIGLLITIPLILFCSALIMRLMGRFPILITLGGGLLGYVAGEMAVADPSIKGWIDVNAGALEMLVPILGAASVIIVGKRLARRAEARKTNGERAGEAGIVEAEVEAAEAN